MLDKLPLKADISNLLNESIPNGLDKIWIKFFGKKQAEINSEIKRIETESLAHERLLNAQVGRAEKLISNGEATYNIETKSVVLIESLKYKRGNDETKNLLGCFVPAVKALKSKASSTESPVSHEFLNRWRDEAKLIESEDLRVIWGNLLAEEVRHPNSISLRTLDVLRNLSRDEVDLFVNICPHILEGKLLPESIIKESNSYTILSESGLLSHRDTPFYYPWSTSKLTNETGKKIGGHVIGAGDILIRADDITGETPQTRVYYLTRAGAEIYKIASESIDFSFEEITTSIVNSSGNLGALYFFRKQIDSRVSMQEDLLMVTNDNDITSAQGTEEPRN